MKILVALGVLFASAAHAQSLPSGFPTDVQVQAALNAYPGVAAARARVDAALADRDLLRAGPYEFTLSGSYIRRDVEREGRFKETDVTLSRTIRLPWKGSLDRKAGALGVEVAENQREDTRHQAALVLSELWHDWMEADELLRSDQQALEMQKTAVAAVRRRADLKDAAALDLDQAAAAESLALAQLADSRAKLEKARVTLAATFPEIPLSAEAPPIPAPEMPVAGVDRLRDLVISRSHEIRAAENEAERLSLVARRTHADRIPDPTVGVRTFRERGGLENGVGVQLSIPLGFSHRRAAASKASAQASAAGFERDEVRRAIQAVADADAADVRTRIAAWSSTAESARSAGTAAARTDRGHQLGAIDLADLLFIQKQANDARRAEIAARSAGSRALLKLLIDSHEIWAEAHDEHDEAGHTDSLAP
jgi:outer membrane protein TolC